MYIYGTKHSSEEQNTTKSRVSVVLALCTHAYDTSIQQLISHTFLGQHGIVGNGKVTVTTTTTTMSSIV